MKISGWVGYNTAYKGSEKGGMEVKVKELIFVVEEDPEGGYTARALGESIFTEADDLETLKENIRDAMECHFDRKEDVPRIVRLHIVREETFAYV